MNGNTGLRKTFQQAIDMGYPSAEGIVLTSGRITPRGKLSIDHEYHAKPIAFHDLRHVETKPGLYQIFTDEGMPLKVGIASNLRSRLRQHIRSAQKYLVFKTYDGSPNPNNVVSKRSILAKHLYFDEELTNSYDLKSEEGRNSFLINECYALITYTESREKAKELEAKFESMKIFRYQGTVIKR